MARRYDSRTTIFSPEGRLYQVEYAMEAISNAGAAIGMLCTDGVVLVAEKKITSKVMGLTARLQQTQPVRQKQQPRISIRCTLSFFTSVKPSISLQQAEHLPPAQCNA
jgi:hypothetical protein